MVTVQTLRGSKNFENVVVNHPLVTVGVDRAKRGCSCAKCGANGDRIEKGQPRIMVVTSSDEKVYHEKCYSDMVNFVADSDTQATNYSANSTIDHEIVVIANKELAGWFYTKGFVAKKHSPSHRKFTLDCERNRHRSGHLISTLLNNGFKVLVNGTEVTSWSDFELATR